MVTGGNLTKVSIVFSACNLKVLNLHNNSENNLSVHLETLVYLFDCTSLLRAVAASFFLDIFGTY